MSDEERRRRAVTPEWAYDVTGSLMAIEERLDRIMAFMGIGDVPGGVQHTSDGMFASGSGRIRETQGRMEQRAAPESMADALAQARAAIENACRRTERNLDAEPLGGTQENPK